MPRSDQEMAKAFREPFAATDIQWRIGRRNKEKTRGMALAYIDARAVMRRLDEVCGPMGWQTHLESHEKTFLMTLTVWSDEQKQWISRSDAADATDIGDSKGGASGALKRVAVQFGIGSYLYEVDSPWVALEKSMYIAKSELGKLAKLLGEKKAAAAKREEPPAEDDQTAAPGGDELGLSDDQKDTLWAANDRAVAQFFPEPTPAQQYACLEFALGKLGVEAIDQVKAGQYETLLTHMRLWWKQMDAGSKQSATKPTEKAE